MENDHLQGIITGKNRLDLRIKPEERHNSRAWRLLKRPVKLGFWRHHRPNPVELPGNTTNGQLNYTDAADLARRLRPR